ncbi:asparaginase [Puniceicoccales bacterium CK1056]|uniref:Asparaginase n=1 Tax=Oceanipulchritudo coccoides TaxID=2706888 RepID=A0A6B2M1P3_9BACT|nr:asparaginase domain-containing protein [Oceanipulchritudo coccoides]NDV61997.1 asparaginase [Oceanipulchritudo coccoides]
MNDSCLIITTGGTIDKVYFDAKSTFSVGDPQIGEVFRQAHVSLAYEILPLMRKDSLEMTDEDRTLIRGAILKADNRQILVTHGTDTMTDTGKFLAGIPDKTIVLTGALIPARFRENDAIFNIGFALAAAQTLSAGVYIAMNGCIYDPERVLKDREANRFVEVSPEPVEGQD